MAHGAGLILRRLVVHWTAGPNRREGVALQAEQVDQTHFEETGISGTVWRVATAATFGLDGDMLVDERSLLVDVALVANRIAAGEGSRLSHGRGAVRVMAVAALHKTLIDPVVIGLGKIGLCRRVASVAKLRLLLNQQVLLFGGVMGGVTVETSDCAAGVGRVRKMRLLTALAVAGEAAGAGLLPGMVLEYENLGFVAAAGDVVRTGTVAAFATLLGRPSVFI